MRDITTQDVANTPFARPQDRDTTSRVTLVQATLLLVSFGTLIYAWNFPFTVLLNTPWLDVTVLEPVLLVGAVTLLATRAWRLVRREDRVWLALLLVYVGWLVAAAVLRTDALDVKRAASYLLFLGLSIAVAFAAARLGARRAARWLVVFFVAVAILAMLGALVERVTYSKTADPLAGFWALFRPQQKLDMPNIGVFGHAPLHYPLPAAGLIRVTGTFGHPLYLAFFTVLAAGILSAAALQLWRQGRPRSALVALAALGAAVVTNYWTYSRAPLAGLVAVVVAVLALDLLVRVWARRSLPRGRELVPMALVFAVFVGVLGTSMVVDDTLRRRLGAGVGAGPTVDETDDVDAVTASAAGAGRLRLGLQRVAISLSTESPQALAIGPGMTAYENKLKTLHPSVQRYTHPHSAWHTILVSGGIPGVVLLAALLLAVFVGVLRTLRRRAAASWARIGLLWAGAWIPTWAVVQLFGLNPLSGSESVILGSVIGFGAGFSFAPDDHDTAVT